MILRPAQPSDAMNVARVHVRSWQAAYRTLLPDDFLDRLRPEDRAARYDFATTDPLRPWTVVAEEVGSIIGFATTMPSRDADAPRHGEVCALYVDPECWGKGIGKALISAARARLVEQGFQRAILWMLVGNSHADRFYRKDDWMSDGKRRTDNIWGITIEEIRYHREL